ncbi:ATP-binding protein [Mammaliicoccus sciuri]|uniref:histidine kinase n=1 Tax=Sporosarcina newyorkensis TaxID=759851 RepID=A0A1T4XDU2_9BACL|nr:MULTISPECIES: ATP-binding protein [Sporosarcina]MBY0222673.1 HAMP domain-containing protein [Sporosarcina aquimarina]SKA87275.1 two-component system, OmpR family, sensor histidine kinase ResE [Sporosarcina newyorkensis]
MIRIWNSIVGKLWATILLLVSFVLFIVTLLLLEFLDNFHTKQAEESLQREAATISKIVNDHEGQTTSSMHLIIEDILDTETNAIIVGQEGQILYSFHTAASKEEIEKKLLSERSLFESPEVGDQIVKEMILPSLDEDEVMGQYLILSYPYEQFSGEKASVLMYQSLDAVHRTTKSTTNIVFLSAFIAFILTTFFAFFLSTRITLPLRKMKQAAFELSKGNFDTHLPVAQNDEIGQLATAFNQMGRQLKYNMELIKQEKEQLSSILTSMTDAVVTFNQDYSILLKNPQAELLLKKWYGYNEKKHHPLPKEVFHMLEHAISFSEEVEDELELGGQFYVISISPLYSENNIRGAVAVFRDMTEQHKLDKLRSDFIANVSHELRTPISMLQGYSEAIIDDVVSSEEERMEMVRIIHDESKRMSRLVTDLLDLARMESGHIQLHENPLPIFEFMNRMVTKFSQVAKDAQVNLTLNTEESSNLVILADEDRLEQVFTNLIDNAIRHTPNGGEVTLGIHRSNGMLDLSVSDTGVGIPEKDLPFVFERFYKADKARTRGKGGTGLGLAIAKNIMDAHHGSILAKHGDEKGTVFICSLPFDSPKN